MSGPAGPREVVLALGSNLGDRLANLQAGIDALTAGPEITATAVSAVYETRPVGGPEQPDYLNAVLLAVSALPARAVLDRCQAAERERVGAAHARHRHHRLRRGDQRRTRSHAAASAGP